MQYRLTRALRYATIAVFMAAGFEALEHLISPTFTIWQSGVAAILACAAIVFLLASVGFSRERNKEQRFSEADQQLHEITGHSRAQDAIAESEVRYRSLFENMLDGFAYCEMLFDDRGRPADFVYLAVNGAFGTLTGLRNVVGKRFTEVIPRGKDLQPELLERYGRVARTGTPERFEIEIKALGMWFSISAYGAEKGRFVATFDNITDRKVAEERIQFLAYYDALTGLPNRTLLQDRLLNALADARRQKCKVALLFLDLDRFKDINDSLGHSVGDLLLQEVAKRLKALGREQDTVSRLAGDEFLILLTHIKDLPDAAVATERFMDAMTAEFIVQGHSVNVGCSVGISVFPDHGADVEALIKNADAAMYSAKDGGRNIFRFFTEDMSAQVVERLTLEKSLRLALAKEELFLMYQPQMDISTGRITGLEALLRWQHPDLGLVPPDKFIRIAENSGLIVPIGEWVLRTACAQARKWQDEGLPAVTTAVNVSAVQFHQEDFCALVRTVLRETGLAPQYLELELTESLLLENADRTLSVVQELKAMGLTLAIDDFGTGYSSFSYLRQFRVSKLKIDGSFIRDVAANPDDAAITAAIISMAKSLRLKVIAEGVENEAQMSFLRGHHCDEIQGYYFSKPLAVRDVADKLRCNVAETQVGRKPAGDNRDDKPYEVRISLMSIGLALLVSPDQATIHQFSLALGELSISPEACQDAASAVLLLKRRKFDAVIVDLQLGEQSGMILDEVHLSPSNGTAVTFGIGNDDAESTAAFRKKSQFVFERPLSPQSIHKTLKPAYGLILRERRRYFRCPVSIPVIIQRENRQEVRCFSLNISEGGMALRTQVPLLPGESVRVLFPVPDHEAPLLAESTICWSKTGHSGVRFVSISDQQKSELQVWLSQKLEQILPEFVADQFGKSAEAVHDLHLAPPVERAIPSDA
jgi:diguanylate cyclase (GGDEF)-like protein